jgi:hypothetical protein
VVAGASIQEHGAKRLKSRHGTQSWAATMQPAADAQGDQRALQAFDEARKLLPRVRELMTDFVQRVVDIGQLLHEVCVCARECALCLRESRPHASSCGIKRHVAHACSQRRDYEGVVCWYDAATKPCVAPSCIQT